MDTPRPAIFDLTFAELQALLASWGEPGFRAKQLYRQLYVKLADGFEKMTELPVALRERLALETDWSRLVVKQVVTCDAGMTRKAVMNLLPGGEPVETVLMVYPDRATVCVSSQSGCPMGCVFCATAKLGFLQDLSSGQILAQVMWAEQELRALRAEAGLEFPKPVADRMDQLGRGVTNVVFMGMGEAFNNYASWWQSVERLHDPDGYNLGARAMTVSTVGLVPGILKLADAPLPINLAISLHAADDALRTELMPVNRSFPLAALMEATREYIAKTRRRVSFEYVLLQDQNDSPEQALKLAHWLRGDVDGGDQLLCHVNLIPWNPVPGTPLVRSQRKRVLAFQEVLQKKHVPCTVRVERGLSIGAACGQLAGADLSEPGC